MCFDIQRKERQDETVGKEPHMAAGELLGRDEEAGFLLAHGRPRHALEERQRIRHVTRECRRGIHVQRFLQTHAHTLQWDKTWKYETYCKNMQDKDPLRCPSQQATAPCY